MKGIHLERSNGYDGEGSDVDAAPTGSREETPWRHRFDVLDDAGVTVMRIFGLVGRSGAGKTTLIERLLPLVHARGLVVSTMKHAHHGFDMDRPGKDTWRHRAAGAAEVMVVSGERWALLAEQADGAEPDVDALVSRMKPVDLLLIEGFRAHSHPKIEVHRPSLGKDLLWRPGSDIVAIASDEPIPGVGVPVLDLDDAHAIVDFVLAPAVAAPLLAAV